MSFLNTFFGIPEDNDSELKSYVESLGFRSDYVKLEGPFLWEQHALKYMELYKDLLKKTYYRINMCVTRPLVLISSDETLDTNDNGRVKLGIAPFNHRFYLSLNCTDFTVIGVDGQILLNGEDSLKLKKVLRNFPITLKEEEMYLGKKLDRHFSP